MQQISSKRGTYLWPLLIAAVTLLVFLPSLRSGLVGWDDSIITDNPRTRELSAGSIFRTFVPDRGISSSYQPFRSLIYSLGYSLWGADPAGYILLGLLLYIANVCLFYRLALLLAGNVPGRAPPAVLVAVALFAFHPVHVEVVSWHQGLKMTLMGMFFLLSLIGYIRFRRGEGRRHYWFSLVSFVVSLLTQPAAVSLPFVLVAWELAFRPGRSEGRGDVALRLAPFFLPAVALGFHLMFVSTVRLGAGAAGDSSLAARLCFLPVVWGKSLLKLLLPVNISARYPLDIPSSPQLLRSSGWLLFCAVAGWAAWRMAPHRRAGLFVLLFFVLTILPTSGLIETSTLIADRYLYLAGMPVFLAAGWGIGYLLSAGRAGQQRFGAVYVATVPLAVLAVVSLISITMARQADWRDRVSLWTRVVEVYPRHGLGHFNLADAWNARGERDKAAGHYNRALQINPNYGDAWANLSTLTLSRGDGELALKQIGRAMELRPDRAEVWIKRGIIMASTGDDSTAEASFRRAIEIDQGWDWAGYFNLGMLYAARGDTARAADQLALALDAALSKEKPDQIIESIRRAAASLPTAGKR